MSDYALRNLSADPGPRCPQIECARLDTALHSSLALQVLGEWGSPTGFTRIYATIMLVGVVMQAKTGHCFTWLVGLLLGREIKSTTSCDNLDGINYTKSVTAWALDIICFSAERFALQCFHLYNESTKVQNTQRVNNNATCTMCTLLLMLVGNGRQLNLPRGNFNDCKWPPWPYEIGNRHTEKLPTITLVRMRAER